MQSEGRIDHPKFSQFHPYPLDNDRDGSSVPVLIVIGGATATGKSGLAIALASRLNSVILSADSRQVYQEFNIGTAKPSPDELARVPHYLIDLCLPTDTLTLAQYQQAAQALILQIHQQGGVVPLLVGGTGLYIDAVIKGLKIPPVAPQPELRSHLTTLGQTHCYALLQQVDPEAAGRIHPHDPVRTQRALEVFYVTGLPISVLQGEVPPTYPMLYLGLECSGAALEPRITTRTQHMVDLGFVAEVESLVHKYGPTLPLMKTLGYAEMVAYLQGDISLEQAIALIIQHTRQFAKRQRTWFHNRVEVCWFDADAPNLLDQVWEKVESFLQYVAKCR